jgi:hypothetical protein
MLSQLHKNIIYYIQFLKHSRLFGYRIYIDFVVDPVTLALTAVNTQTGNTILQICNIAVTNVPYLDLSVVAGRPEQIGNEPCHFVSLTIILLP